MAVTHLRCHPRVLVSASPQPSLFCRSMIRRWFRITPTYLWTHYALSGQRMTARRFIEEEWTEFLERTWETFRFCMIVAFGRGPDSALCLKPRRSHTG